MMLDAISTYENDILWDWCACNYKYSFKTFLEYLSYPKMNFQNGENYQLTQCAMKRKIMNFSRAKVCVCYYVTPNAHTHTAINLRNWLIAFILSASRCIHFAYDNCTVAKWEGKKNVEKLRACVLHILL